MAATEYSVLSSYLPSTLYLFFVHLVKIMSIVQCHSYFVLCSLFQNVLSVILFHIFKIYVELCHQVNCVLSANLLTVQLQSDLPIQLMVVKLMIAEGESKLPGILHSQFRGKLKKTRPEVYSSSSSIS